ncbi:Mss4-like protein [Dactylonectria macrodidyma]|uniref:Mss4-like protein n=1 Tax=Dactylonectria macrodidyma TaxID=307937 RepID=A0A9P9DNS5_9HYPO|nr:Mss4-like protein [Dactylonectria macrodidyma]
MNPKIRCQCGTIVLYASAPQPIEVYCCHCLECQRQSSSAFGTSAMFPAEGMWPLPEDVRAKLGVWTRPTDSGNTLECYFCTECGVRILHRSILPDGTPKPTLSIKGGCLEGLSWEGAKHIYTRSARVPVPGGGDPGSPVVAPTLEPDVEHTVV